MNIPLDIVEGGDRAHERGPTDAKQAGGSAAGKPTLQVFFRCSNQYVRVVRGEGDSGYTARCPKCGKTMRFAVGEGGTSRRFFELSC